MSCLVAGLHMYEYEVVVLKCLDGSLSLAFVVGIGQSCGTFHLYNLQSSIVAYATNQVNSRNHSTTLYLRILLHQRLHRRTIAATPRPDTVCLALTTLSTLLVERVLS